MLLEGESRTEYFAQAEKGKKYINEIMIAMSHLCIARE